MRSLLSLLLISLGSVSHAEDRIIEVASGREISRAQLLAQARQSDFLLLGEIHDNPHHHFRRAELITALAPKAIHAEQLEEGRRTEWAQSSGEPLKNRLTTAGFDAAGWQWPLHEPLFASLAEARIDVVGANISRDLARRIVREGNAALPARLAAALTANPLSPSAEVALDADLLDSHCGQLPATRLPRMRLAQRARDAAMALGVTSLPVRPAILVAGNGHVRSDYGVPALLARLRPGARIINIAFEEEGKATDAGAAYTHIWTTPAVHRDDPCKGFSQARP
ncbi:ChaN family lipoprotein [Zoogloea sp.]|uniref:ChaN family lipoprotein n=1 Tax=Zoogloea sp. TaxID=49181 RepID=UPI0035B1607D